MEKPNWSLIKVKAKDLKPNPKIPKITSEKGFRILKKSLDKFGAVYDGICNKDLSLIDGHSRLSLKKSNDDCLVFVPDRQLSEKEYKEFNLIFDHAKVGEFDMELVKEEFEDVELEEWEFDLEKIETLEAQEDDFEVGNVAEIKTDIVLGDLFEIGEHRLLCADSTQIDTFIKLFDGQMADMVITDPPYNVAYEGKTKDALTIKNDKQGDKEFYQFLYDFYTAQATVCKMGGAWYIWHADSEGANFRQAMKDAGIMAKQCLIWVKNSMVMGRQDYQWKHEPCLYGWKEGAAHGWFSDRKQTTVLNFDRPNRNAEHPTMKPIQLFAYQISNSSKEGDIIADGFGGSGTTMIASHQMNRKAYLVEFDTKYCDVIIRRMIKLDNTLKIKRNGIDETNKWLEKIID